MEIIFLEPQLNFIIFGGSKGSEKEIAIWRNWQNVFGESASKM